MNTRLSRVMRGRLVCASHLFNTARTWSARLLSCTAVLCAGLMIGGAQAGFQVVEDFDSLNLADINGQNGWDSDPGSAEVVQDPAGGGNQVLKVLTESGELFKAATVAAGTTRMLFLRLRFEAHGRYSFGLSFASNPIEYIDFQAELGMAAATNNDPSNGLRVANGLSNEIYDVLSTLVPGTWYNVWVLVNNGSQTYEVWLNSDPGGDAQASDQLSNDAAGTLFGFRTAPGSDLNNFFIKTGGGSSPVDGRFYLDDIYLENTGDTNLSNPLDQLPADPVDLGGDVEDSGGTGLCAMVLASGQYTFSCNPNGPFSLTDLPRANDGTVKRQVYVDGFFPEIDVLEGSISETVVMTHAGTCPDYNLPSDPGVFPGSAGKRIDISGSVLLQDTPTPICAMVLANGQYAFSCDGSGSYAMNIPLDNNGQFKLQVYADGFAPTILRFDEFSAENDVRMARAVECQ